MSRRLDKNVARVTSPAVARGWSLDASRGRTNSHHRLALGHHRITLASSPSDQNAAANIARRIRHCEAGTCEHGLPAARDLAT